ncbi:hypothetical protein RB195_000615 [Necator americanus]|uniref:EGF-like domain-containing protein n=1 Tax=Necator americanus TaxID=51031 RepID=A0ABR1DAR0_NECAM
MENDLKEELNRRMRAAWAAFAAVREATDQLTDHDLRAHLFDSTVLPALCYAAETGMSRLRDPAEYVSKAKHRWAGHIMRRIDDRWTKSTLEWIPRDAKRPRGRPPTRWSDVFAARMDQLRAQLDTAQGPRQPSSPPTESTSSTPPAEASSPSTESSSSTPPAEASSPSTESSSSTPPAEALTTVNVSNDRTAINGKLLLQKSLALSNKINSLTNQIYSLEAAINSTNSPYFTQLNQMREQAIKMNATLATLLENLDVQLKRQTAVDIQVANITRMYACMAASSCVTKKPTTTVPTTTYPLSVCPDVNPPPATSENQTISVNETENVYCTAAFSSVNASIDLYVDVAINGSNAALNIKNAVTGDLIMNFTNSDTGFVETGSKSVVIVYSADRYSSIGFDITYNTVTSDPCSDYPCAAKSGKCMVVPSTGLPYCQCNACYSGQNCSTETDPCTITAKRLCKNKGQICGPNPTVTDYCGYVCLSTTTTQGLGKSIRFIEYTV